MRELTPITEYGPLDGKNYEFGWQGPWLQAHLLSDVGCKRAKNEDSCMMCIPEPRGLAEKRGLLFAVADGMGGASAGEYASRMALQLLREAYYANEKDSVPKALELALAHANERVFEEAEVNPTYAGMGTTVSACVLLGDWVYIAQVGDSRVYLVRERSGIYQLTHDHSLVAEQVRNGLITEDEARTHSLKNLITRAVGIKESVAVDLFAVRVRQNDTLLLCSDGLCNVVPDDYLARALANGDLRAGTRGVVKEAINEGGPDNITVITIRFKAQPPKAPLEEGAEAIEPAPPSLVERLRRLFS